MKKILFGTASAIFAVVAFSSFKTKKKFAVTKYYFLVKAGIDIAFNHSVAPCQITF
jgi:hypothetical protein